MSAIPARVQASSGLNTTFVSSVAATFTNPTVAGNAILVATEYDSGAANSGNVPTDTAGHKYFRLGSVRLAATFELEIWMASNIKAQASNIVTATDTNAGVDSIICIEEWSGLTSASLAGNASAGATGSSANLSSGALVATCCPGIIFVAGVTAVGTSTLVLGAGYSNLTQNNTTFSNLGIESQIITSAQSFTGTFTNTSASWAALGVAIPASNYKFPTGMRPHPFSPGLAR